MADGAIQKLVAAPLTVSTFAPFGDVVDSANAKRALDINQGHTTRFHDLAKIDVSDDGGDVCISIFRSTPMQVPVTISVMERHPLGSQAFIPLERRPYLVVVSPPGPFQPERTCAFLANGDQGVNYAKGVWHHFLLALDAQSDFLAIDRKGPGDNLDEVKLPAREQFLVQY